jgi:hypothetical protein
VPAAAVTGYGAVRATVRKALPEELPAVSGVLSRAFHDDPVSQWAFPDPDRRRQLLPRFFELIATALRRHDELYLAPDTVGAAMWAPPGAELGDQGIDRAMEAFAGADTARLLEVGALLAEHHPTGSYWYLQFVGVACCAAPAGSAIRSVATTRMHHGVHRSLSASRSTPAGAWC